MQFPKGKKERIQIAAVAVIVVAGVLYGLITFIILPFEDSYASCLTETERLKGELDSINKEIGKGKNAKEECETMRASLREIDRAFVLKDEFGNYNINADKHIKNIFAAVPGAKLDIDPPDGQQVVIPMPKGNKLKAFVKTVNCSITGRGSYEYLLELFKKTETENPYISISRVNIGPVKPESMVQSVTFSITFPIWDNPATPASFEPRPTQSDEATNSVPVKGKKKEPRK